MPPHLAQTRPEERRGRKRGKMSRKGEEKQRIRREASHVIQTSSHLDRVGCQYLVRLDVHRADGLHSM
eukprot:759009-Hanusia_phi.AAC.4